MSIQSAAHTRNTTTTHLSAGRSFTTWQTLTPLSLCQLTLCQCTTGKVSTIFTWTTKRNVCCDKTKKIEIDLHVGHPFTIQYTYWNNSSWFYLLLNKNMNFYSGSSNSSNNYSFFFICIPVSIWTQRLKTWHRHNQLI